MRLKASTQDQQQKDLTLESNTFKEPKQEPPSTHFDDSPTSSSNATIVCYWF